jgi:hypothetical protein
MALIAHRPQRLPAPELLHLPQSLRLLVLRCETISGHTSFYCVWALKRAALPLINLNSTLMTWKTTKSRLNTDEKALLGPRRKVGYLKKNIARGRSYREANTMHTARLPYAHNHYDHLHHNTPLRLSNLHLSSSQEVLLLCMIFCLGNPPVLENLFSPCGTSWLECHLKRIGLDNEERIRLV